MRKVDKVDGKLRSAKGSIFDRVLRSMVVIPVSDDALPTSSLAGISVFYQGVTTFYLADELSDDYFNEQSTLED